MDRFDLVICRIYGPFSFGEIQGILSFIGESFNFVCSKDSGLLWRKYQQGIKIFIYYHYSLICLLARNLPGYHAGITVSFYFFRYHITGGFPAPQTITEI